MIAQRQLLTQRGETSPRSSSSGFYRRIDVITGGLLAESTGNSTRTRETSNSRAFMEPAPKQESLTTGPMAIRRLASWLGQIDPGVHRRIKGLRLVTAYGIAALLGAGLNRSYEITGGASLTYLAAGFALWASVSEAEATRWLSTRDLAVLNAAAVAGAMMYVGLSSISSGLGHAGPEWILIAGAFLVGYLKRFGILGAGVGSQIYIGQLLGYTTGITRHDLAMVSLAGLVAGVASIVPRLLSGPAEHPTVAKAEPPVPDGQGSREMRMGLQSAIAALVIVLVSGAIGLQQSAWAVTASTYVIAGSASGTADRVRRRILGTLIGVPLGILCMPISVHVPPLAWMLAAVAMIVYAMALPDRYDIACGAYAFTLMVTLAISGETTVSVLAARGWETLIGGALGVAAAKFIAPLPSTRLLSLDLATVPAKSGVPQVIRSARAGGQDS
jgi:Fusaric acid resistance protein-like